MIRKYWLIVIAVVQLTSSNYCSAGNKNSIYEDVKYFVQNNHHYRHGLTVASGIYSFLLFNTYLQKNRGNFDSNAQLGLTFGGSYIVSKIVQENPGFTTMVALGIVVYSLFK